jgi:hypothetical protein
MASAAETRCNERQEGRAPSFVAGRRQTSSCYCTYFCCHKGRAYAILYTSIAMYGVVGTAALLSIGIRSSHDRLLDHSVRFKINRDQSLGPGLLVKDENHVAGLRILVTKAVLILQSGQHVAPIRKIVSWNRLSSQL